MAPYVVADGDKVGAVDEARVTAIIEILSEAGAIPAGFTPEQAVDFAVAPQG